MFDPKLVEDVIISVIEGCLRMFVVSEYRNSPLTIFTQPLRSGRIWHKVNIFKRSSTGLNSEFSFS